MKGIKIVLLISLVAAVSGCSKFSVEPPDGFALVEQRERDVFRAMSPEGMQYEVRLVEPSPSKPLDFWKESLYYHLTEEGYQEVREETEFTTENSNGMLYEWGVPYKGEDYLYMTALIEAHDHLLIAETAAEVSIYKKYRDAIMDSLKSITIQ
jgi:hypothetical protein